MRFNLKNPPAWLVENIRMDLEVTRAQMVSVGFPKSSIDSINQQIDKCSKKQLCFNTATGDIETQPDVKDRPFENIPDRFNMPDDQWMKRVSDMVKDCPLFLIPDGIFGTIVPNEFAQSVENAVETSDDFGIIRYLRGYDNTILLFAQTTLIYVTKKKGNIFPTNLAECIDYEGLKENGDSPVCIDDKKNDWCPYCAYVRMYEDVDPKYGHIKCAAHHAITDGADRFLHGINDYRRMLDTIINKNPGVLPCLMGLDKKMDEFIEERLKKNKVEF